MNSLLSRDYLYNLDMVEIKTGEILTVYGNYCNSLLRVRLSFFPSCGSDRLINGKKYCKAKYETGYEIHGLRKILDLPGEQHFLLHRSQITKVYRSVDAFIGLPKEYILEVEQLVRMFEGFCGIECDLNGLTGSGALHSIIQSSDFDWVIYKREYLNLKNFVVSHGDFTRELTFEMKHVYVKYAHIQGLSKTDLDKLFDCRWKYFRYRNLCISVTFVDPFLFADDFLGPVEFGERVFLTGIVSDGVGCYHTPRFVPVSCDKVNFVVLTWLFLYNGAFAKGDIVEVSGRRCKLANRDYVLVESSLDYIKKISHEDVHCV